MDSMGPMGALDITGLLLRKLWTYGPGPYGVDRCALSMPKTVLAAGVRLSSQKARIACLGGRLLLAVRRLLVIGQDRKGRLSANYISMLMDICSSPSLGMHCRRLTGNVRKIT